MKGIASMGIIAIIVIVAAVVFISDIPALVSGGLLSIMKTPISCDNGPYVEHCFCEQGEMKWVRGGVLNLPEYYCSPAWDDQQWRDDEYAEYGITAISTLFPNCDTFECIREDGDWLNTLMVIHGSGGDSGEYIRVECKGVQQTPTGQIDRTFWNVHLDMDNPTQVLSGGWFFNHCSSYDGTLYKDW